MTIDIQIGNTYPTRWSRREPGGLFWPVTPTSAGPILAVELSMEGDGSGPFRIEFPGRKDGRWFRGTAWKPEVSGTWWPLVKAFATLDNEGPKSVRRGPHKVTVTEDAVFLPADPPGPAPFQIRAAFYYPWFVGPGGWGMGTVYHPTLGRYDLLDLTVIDAHIRALEYGRFDAAIASWWGQGHPTDGRISALLERSEGHALRWALYYEMEGHTHPPVAQIRADLDYIRARYASHPNYLRIGGRFVVFVYSADDGATCDVATRWRQANDKGDVYIVLKVVGNYADCPDQPDGWHQYGPSNDVQTTWDNAGRLHAYNISPGFWHAEEGSARLERDLARWNRNIRDMVASNARWQLVTSFNEHGEGSGVEACTEWASPSGFGLYLDALRANGL